MTTAAVQVAPLTMRRGDDENEPRQRPLDFRLLRRLLSYTAPHAAKRNWLFLCVVLRAMQLPAIAWTIGAVINGPISSGASSSAILWGAAGLLGLALFTQITFHFRQRLALELGEAVIHDLRGELFAHLQTMPLSFFHKTKIGRLISRVTSDSEAVRTGVQDVLFVGLVGLGQMLVAASLMAWYDWLLFAVLAAMSPILWLLNRYFRQRLSESYQAVQESFSGLTATLAESINGIRVTQSFVREEQNRQLFRDQLQSHAHNVVQAVKLEGLLLPLLECNSQLFFVALLVVGGYRVLQHETEPGDLIRFFFLANIFFSPIQILGNLYNQTLTAMAGAERIFRFLDTPPEWVDAPTAQPLPPLQGVVQLDHVSFSYVPGRPVLHDISFTAQPGETIALVGKTGSGKSTIIQLIARFYLPTAGTLCYDGHETRAISAASLRSQLGLVLQSNFLFTGSVYENIRVGRPEATNEEIVEAVRALGCYDMLAVLPQGLDTQVGERGAQLSLGQRQLVCFARAMLANPRILILDEATSSVDALTESKVQEALHRLLHNRTSFIVAHRLSTIRHAHQVLVLDSGRIVERGTHMDLLSRGELYAQLVRQFLQGVQEGV